MTHVATLISAARTSALDADALTRAAAALPAPQAPAWLAPGEAADIAFTPSVGTDNHTLTDRIRATLEDRPLDVVVQPLAHRRKRLLVADMDSTMIEQECIDELADYVGLKAQVAVITERAMRGEIAFTPALRDRVALLKGLPAHVVDEVIAERITLMPGSRTLIATMRANGAYTCLVSGGFTTFTQRIAASIGFDEHRANTLALAADKTLTGRVVEPILGQKAKRDALAELAARHGVAPPETMAVGDGANDLSMIEAAGLGVAYRAKPRVAAAAAARIDHGDLTALLYVQGYKREEFVEG